MMRRTILLVCVFALAFAGFGGPARAAPDGVDIPFELACPGGIKASGHQAGWMGAWVIEAGKNVPVPGVAHPWAFEQVTKKYDADGKLVDTGYGWWDVPGTRPGAVEGCRATLGPWTPHPLVVGEGIAYEIAYLKKLEVTFSASPS